MMKETTRSPELQRLIDYMDTRTRTLRSMETAGILWLANHYRELPEAWEIILEDKVMFAVGSIPSDIDYECIIKPKLMRVLEAMTSRYEPSR